MTDVRSRGGLPLMLLGAALTALTLIFPSVGILEWLTLIPLYLGLYRLSDAPALRLRRYYLYGFLTVYVYNFVLYHWFLNLYPLDFVGMDEASSLVVVLAGWLGLPLLQAIPGGLMLAIFFFFQKRGLFERAPLLRPFVFASLWVLLEWISTLGWTGVPWGRLCLGQAELLPMLQSASLFGSYFVSFLILLVNGLVAYAILYRMRATLCGVTAICLFLFNFGFGWGRMRSDEKAHAQDDTVRVAVIQGNISSHEKWDGGTYTKMKEVHADLTRKAAERGAELVVWAETALPYVLNTSPDLCEYVSELAQECRVYLIVGALYTSDMGEDYNVLYLVEPSGEIREEVYAKRHLVPFGEYVPMKELIMTLIPPLAELSALDSDLVAGEDSALFETEWGSIGSLICFDSIYEELNRDSIRDGAELMVISTNDSWFRDSAAVYMHQRQAQLRAIEGGRSVVRSANTGISTVISPTGENMAWIDPLVEGYAVADVQLRSSQTVYMTLGNLWVYLSVAFCALLFVISILLPFQKVKPVVMRAGYGKAGRG